MNNQDYHVQTVDGISFPIKKAYDFSFLSRYGTVFKVFYKQSSGNLCFGVEKKGKRYFLKFAGAKTIHDGSQNVEDAITRLKYSVPKYKELKHPLLIHQIDAEEVGGGFITVFDWFEGESCGYPQPEMCRKFMALPGKEKIRVFEGILEFHTHVAKCGYVAIDFNDQSTLYNFCNGEFLICDIDFYVKQCYMNGSGNICGDPSLMSPEESRGYAIIDEISNVYTMGATSFVFFAEGDKYSHERWTLSDKLYNVVKKATNENRSERQRSVAQLFDEWQQAKF